MKSIKVKGTGSLKELFEWLNRMLPDWEWQKWSITEYPAETAWLSGTAGTGTTYIQPNILPNWGVGNPPPSVIGTVLSGTISAGYSTLGDAIIVDTEKCTCELDTDDKVQNTILKRILG